MTDLFVCEQCGAIDSVHATQQLSSGFKCHECVHGHWHNQFPKEYWSESDPTPVINRVGDNNSSFS